MGTDQGATAPNIAVIDSIDPDSLLSATREVYWWAANRGATFDQQVLAQERVGAYALSPFRIALLDAWAQANAHEHSKLRLAFPSYAGAVLMFQANGLDGVLTFLEALELDVADLAAHRRATFKPVPRG